MKKPSKKVPSINKLQKYNFLRSSAANSIKGCDVYGPPISMNFENHNTHQTIFGGILTLVVGIGSLGFFLHSMISTE